MTQLYQRTAQIDHIIRSAGFNLVTIWEHDFENIKEMKLINLNEFDLVEPVKLRDAFYGRRTEPFKLLKNFKKFNEAGKYIDVCSLYLTVMYYDEYPVGHPERIVKPNYFNENWFGLMHCKMIPPRGLYIPVLPFKQTTADSHKLMFGLCRKCMEKCEGKCNHHQHVKCTTNCKIENCLECKTTNNTLKNTGYQCHEFKSLKCYHTDAERAIVGFWTTAEIKKSLEKGYQIMEIYEVQHFKEKSTDLWKNYIKNS